MNQLEADLAAYLIQEGGVQDANDARERRQLLQSENGEEVARELLDILGPYKKKLFNERPDVDHEELRMYLVGGLGLLEVELGKMEEEK